MEIETASGSIREVADAEQPLFAMGAARRSWTELRATCPDFRTRLNACCETLWRVAKRLRCPAD